jgi:S1-C subfamily serine protease
VCFNHWWVLVSGDDDMTEKEREPAPFSRKLRVRYRALIRRYRSVIPLVVVALISFLGILLNRVTIAERVVLTPVDVERIAAETMATATPPPAISRQIYETILPSVVIIRAERQMENETDFQLGGGVVINDEAIIITSLHVVADAIEITVTFADGTSSLAIVVDEDPENDIAILEPETLPSIVVPAVIGRASSVRIGDEAFVIGNPLGLMGSMTTGVISGLDRTFTLRGIDQPLEGLIQFDAAVNPGSSGGPLLNRDGQLIGIVAGLVSPIEQDAFVGIGFAVPIDIAASSAGSPPY